MISRGTETMRTAYGPWHRRADRQVEIHMVDPRGRALFDEDLVDPRAVLLPVAGRRPLADRRPIALIIAHAFLSGPGSGPARFGSLRSLSRRSFCGACPVARFDLLPSRWSAELFRFLSAAPCSELEPLGTA